MRLKHTFMIYYISYILQPLGLLQISLLVPYVHIMLLYTFNYIQALHQSVLKRQII